MYYITEKVTLADLQQARRFINEGNPNAAREVVQQLLREDVYNVEAWRLALTLARTDSERSHAETQLDRALQHQQNRARQSQLSSSPQMVAAAPSIPYVKDYLGEAILTWLLYYAGALVIGFVVNIIFLNQARARQAEGIPVKNIGCLQWLMWVHIAIIGLSLLLAFIFLLLPIIFVTLGALFGAG